MSYQILETFEEYQDVIYSYNSVIFFVKDISLGTFLASNLAEGINDNSVHVGVVDRSEGWFKKDYGGEPSDRHVFKVFYKEGKRLDHWPGDHANYSYYSRKPVLREKRKKIKEFNKDEDYYKYDLSFKEDEHAKEDEYTKEDEHTKEVEYVEEEWQVYHMNDVDNEDDEDDEYDEYYSDDENYIKKHVTGHDDVWSSPNEYMVDYNSDPWYGNFVKNYLRVHLHKDDASDEDEPSDEGEPNDDNGPHDEDILMEPFMDMNCDL